MQLAAAVKARQICEQRLESIVVVQGDAGKEDLIAEAINKLQPQRHDWNSSRHASMNWKSKETTCPEMAGY